MGSFSKATKTKAKLRAAFFGPAGAGKTYTALRIATGLGGPIAVVDTERGSASKYADRFEFDVAELLDRSIDGYCRVISEAAADGYRVLVIDSLSHAWQELLESVDRLASTKYRGNSWSAWSEGTPKQRQLVDALLGFPGHVLATMRSKTVWETARDERGKNTPQRVGLAPEQGKGIEYEFDLLLEINEEHQARVLKDRTGKFQDAMYDRPGEDFGRALADWLDTGTEPAPPPSRPQAPPSASNGHGHEERPEIWGAWISRTLCEVNDDWRNEMAAEGVDKERRKNLTSVDRVVNALCTKAIEANALDPARIAKDDKPEVRDPSKAKQWVARLFDKYPERIKARVEEYLAEKRREARAELGMFDPDSQLEPEPATAPQGKGDAYEGDLEAN